MGEEMLTEKELLQEIRLDMKRMNESLAVLTSQDLNQRVRAIEDWKAQMSGALGFVKNGVAVCAGLLTILTAIVGYVAFFQ